MEEPKPAQTTSQNLPPKPPTLSATNKKRPHDSISHLQDSHYYKMRAVLKDLRPHFREILQVHNFRNCSVANEIREKMKHLMDLYRELTAETTHADKREKVSAAEPSSNEVQEPPKPKEAHRDTKPAVHMPPNVVSKPALSSDVSAKQLSEDGKMQGTYIVGGSAFGWNFITYGGGKSVYYGRTKESFRSANVVSQQ